MIRPIAALLILAGAAPVEPPTPAAVAAALLADADAAAAARTTTEAAQALARILTDIDRTGLYQLDDDHVLETWRQRAGITPLPVTRGRVLGPAFRHGRLAPGGEVQVQQAFAGGEPATIAVASVPREPARATLSVTDATAKCSGAMRQCRWLPLFTQRYTITVRNPTPAPVRFYLVMD